MGIAMLKNESLLLKMAIDKKVNNNGLFDDDENCIDDIYGKDFIKSLQTLNEWVRRVPHVLPFPLIEVNKDRRGRMNYINAIFDVMSAVALNVSIDNQFKSQLWMEVSPMAKEIIEATTEWLISIEKKDAYFFNELSTNNFQIYKIMNILEQEEVKKYVNELSLVIRKRLMSKSSIDSNYKYQKNSTKRFKQMMRVAQQAYSKHASILLIRLDWGYKPQMPDLRGKFVSNEDYVERFLEVAGYRKKMLKILREMFGEDIAFFSWKIECASVKGLHIHWFIGLNGAKHQDRINVAKAIADKWDGVIGNQYAYTWNVNALQKHDEAILKVIGYSDPKLWDIVGGYADYLTKVDYLVRTRTPQGMRSFGCTKLETRQRTVKKGPKRSKDMPALEMLKVRGAFKSAPIQSKKMGA